MKDKGHKKKTLPPLTLPLLEQLQIHLRDLSQDSLCLRERAQALFYFLLELAGDRDLAHLPIAQTHRENPNRPVAFAFALLAKAAAGLIAPHHAAQQGTRQDSGQVRDLLKELLAGSGKLSDFIFHHNLVKDITPTLRMQEKKSQNFVRNIWRG
jgi:hypothetical protein